MPAFQMLAWTISANLRCRGSWNYALVPWMCKLVPPNVSHAKQRLQVPEALCHCLPHGLVPQQVRILDRAKRVDVVPDARSPSAAGCLVIDAKG